MLASTRELWVVDTVVQCLSSGMHCHAKFHHQTEIEASAVLRDLWCRVDGVYLWVLYKCHTSMSVSKERGFQQLPWNGTGALHMYQRTHRTVFSSPKVIVSQDHTSACLSNDLGPARSVCCQHNQDRSALECLHMPTSVVKPHNWDWVHIREQTPSHMKCP